MSQLGTLFRRDRAVQNRCYIIAEMSANHQHDFSRAKEIIKAAAESGADAIKLQTYTADTQTIEHDAEEFRIHGTLWDKKSLYALYKEAYTPWEWQGELKAFANSLGLDCFSTPCDISAVDFLETIDVPCYKVASFEIVDIPLLKRIAKTRRPVFLSTGMATIAEIDEAVRTLRANGTQDLILLKCTSAYPTPPEESNLRTIPHLSAAFDCNVGLSDHTLGSAVAVAAIALGAGVIEKHFTLSRSDGGPDAAFSMEPHEFRELVDNVRTVEKALGAVCYEITKSQQELTPFRRSLYVVRDIKAGESFTPENVRSIRPAYGLHTRYWDLTMTSKASKDLKRGTPLRFSDLA